MHLIVSDIEAARNSLIERGVAVSDTFHDDGGIFHHADSRHLLPGPNPKRKSYASYASFSDHDGNRWVLQEVTARLPPRSETDEAHFTAELVNEIHRESAKAQDDASL